jgi:hypothetical protein
LTHKIIANPNTEIQNSFSLSPKAASNSKMKKFNFILMALLIVPCLCSTDANVAIKNGANFFLVGHSAEKFKNDNEAFLEYDYGKDNSSKQVYFNEFDEPKNHEFPEGVDTIKNVRFYKGTNDPMVCSLNGDLDMKNVLISTLSNEAKVMCEFLYVEIAQESKPLKEFPLDVQYLQESGPDTGKPDTETLMFQPAKSYFYGYNDERTLWKEKSDDTTPLEINRERLSNEYANSKLTQKVKGNEPIRYVAPYYRNLQYVISVTSKVKNGYEFNIQFPDKSNCGGSVKEDGSTQITFKQPAKELALANGFLGSVELIVKKELTFNAPAKFDIKKSKHENCSKITLTKTPKSKDDKDKDVIKKVTVWYYYADKEKVRSCKLDIKSAAENEYVFVHEQPPSKVLSMMIEPSLDDKTARVMNTFETLGIYAAKGLKYTLGEYEKMTGLEFVINNGNVKTVYKYEKNGEIIIAENALGAAALIRGKNAGKPEFWKTRISAIGNTNTIIFEYKASVEIKLTTKEEEKKDKKNDKKDKKNDDKKDKKKDDKKSKEAEKEFQTFMSLFKTYEATSTIDKKSTSTGVAQLDVLETDKEITLTFTSFSKDKKKYKGKKCFYKKKEVTGALKISVKLGEPQLPIELICSGALCNSILMLMAVLLVYFF